jgi:hypothetical protein
MTRRGSSPARGYPELKVTKCVLPKGFRGKFWRLVSPDDGHDVQSCPAGPPDEPASNR